MRIQDNVIVVEFDEQGKLIGSPYKGELVQENNYVNVIEARFPLTGTSDTDSAQSIGARLYCRLPDAEGTVVAYPREIINGVVKANENLVYDDETGKFKCRFRLTRRVTRLKGNIFMTIALIERTEDLYTDDDENQHNIYAVRNQSGFYVSCKESQYEESADSEEDQELIDEIYDRIAILDTDGSGDRFLADDGTYKDIPVRDMGTVQEEEDTETALLTLFAEVEKVGNERSPLYTFRLGDYQGFGIFDSSSRFYVSLYKGQEIRQFLIGYDDAENLTVVEENFGFALKSDLDQKADLDENGKIKVDQMPDGYNDVEYFLSDDFPDLEEFIAAGRYMSADDALSRGDFWKIVGSDSLFPSVTTSFTGESSRSPVLTPQIGFGYVSNHQYMSEVYSVRAVQSESDGLYYFQVEKIQLDTVNNIFNATEVLICDQTNVQYRLARATAYALTPTFQSFFAEISASLALGETASTAYAGDKGKANADAIGGLQETISSTGFGDLRVAKMYFRAPKGYYVAPYRNHFIDKILVIESTPLTKKEIEYFQNGQLVLFFADRGIKRHKNYDKVYTVPRTLWFFDGYDAGEKKYTAIRDRQFFLNRMIGKDTETVNVLGTDCSGSLELKVLSTGETVVRLEMKWCDFLARQLYENADLTYYDHIGLTYSECPYDFRDFLLDDEYKKPYIHFYDVNWSSMIHRTADFDNLISFDSMTLYYKEDYYGNLYNQLTGGTDLGLLNNLSDGNLNEGVAQAYIRNRNARRSHASVIKYGKIDVQITNPETGEALAYPETNPLRRLKYGFETNFKPCFLILKENFEGIKPTEDGVRMYEKKYPFFDKKIYTVFKLKCTSVSKDDPTRDDSKILLQFKSSIV